MEVKQYIRDGVEVSILGAGLYACTRFILSPIGLGYALTRAVYDVARLTFASMSSGDKEQRVQAITYYKAHLYMDVLNISIFALHLIPYVGLALTCSTLLLPQASMVLVSDVSRLHEKITGLFRKTMMEVLFQGRYDEQWDKEEKELLERLKDFCDEYSDTELPGARHSVHALCRPSVADNRDTWVVLFHGNASSAYNGMYYGQFFAARGYSVLCVSASHYVSPLQKQQSEKSRESLYEDLIEHDVEAVKKFLEAQNAQQVIAFGNSMGATHASLLENVMPGRCKVVIHDKPFSRVQDCVTNLIKRFRITKLFGIANHFLQQTLTVFFSGLIDLKAFDNIERVKKFNARYVVIAANNDQLMSHAGHNLGEDLIKAYDSNPSRPRDGFLDVIEGGHNTPYPNLGQILNGPIFR